MLVRVGRVGGGRRRPVGSEYVSDGKSFWSTVPGVVTGMAGVISAIVGLLGISVQLGWIGGDGNGNQASSSDGVSTTVAATVPGTPTTRSSSPTTTAKGEFAVEPASASFEPLKPKEAVVTVENTGDVPLAMRRPTIDPASTAFTVAAEDCSSSTLPPGRSCDVTVVFAATQPGDYTAKLVVAATNAPRQVEVDLKGSRSLLG